MKNLIYIAGNDSYGVEQEVKRWIAVFKGKYGDINIDSFRLENRSDFPIIRDNLTTTGLFADKRLFLFSGGVEKKTKAGGFEELLEQIAADIPEDHFCIFHNLSIKEEGLANWLTKNADVRNIDTAWDIPSWERRFPEIDKKDIQKIVSLYREAEGSHEEYERNPAIGHLIAGTLESLLLSAGTLGGEQSNLGLLIHTEGGGKMFDLVDTILALKVRESILLLRRITETMKLAELLPSLIGLLRSHLYVKFLVSEGKNQNEISTIIKIHPFVLKKSLNSRISPTKMGQFFREIVEINKAYKSGKGLQDGELGRIFAIELALMGLKK